MRNNSRSIRRCAMLTMLLLIGSVAGGWSGPTILAQTSSAPNSPNSAIPVDDGFRRACAEAVEELRAARRVIQARGIETQLLGEMIQLEREISAGLKDLRKLDADQIEQLNKALAAKDRVIAAYEAEIAVLKKQRWGFWKKAQVIAVGIAAGIVVGKVL